MRVVFRVLAGLIALGFVPFSLCWIGLGGIRDAWAWSALVYGVVMGVYSLTGKTTADYSQPAFGSKRRENGGG
jgi:hypothetical protein